MDEAELMTIEQFNQRVRDWSQRVRDMAAATLQANTHGTGHLAGFPVYRDRIAYEAPYYKLKFHFERYGAFRHYGAGRGYVMRNGKPVRQYTDKAMALKQAGRLKEKPRTPLNWLDKHVDTQINGLALLAQEFYGDHALRGIMMDFKKMKIDKR